MLKRDRIESFNKNIAKKIAEKENAYETLYTNLTAAVLPPDVIQDISLRMQKLKDEIEELKNAEPPADYTVDTIKAWLQSIKEAPDEKAIHLLIAKIEAKRKKVHRLLYNSLCTNVVTETITHLSKHISKTMQILCFQA